MKLELNPINYSFSSSKQPVQKSLNQNNSSEKNPISKAGETSLLVKSTFWGGLILGGKLLFELFDGDFLVDIATEKADKIVEHNKRNVKGFKKELIKLGAATGIIAGAVGLFAVVYTLFNAPKIAYNSKVNTFTKDKKMDVYIQANKAEKGLYSELNKQAQNADTDKKQKLKENYMQMTMAKNKLPDFIKLKK